jgi:hypothetical protein
VGKSIEFGSPLVKNPGRNATTKKKTYAGKSIEFGLPLVKTLVTMQ